MNENETLLDAAAEEINCWAYVELFGHQRIAGRVTTKKLGTEVMFQVDVAKDDKDFLCSRLFNPKSIFSLTPTTEEWCRKWARSMQQNSFNLLPYIPDDAVPPTRRLADMQTCEED